MDGGTWQESSVFEDFRRIPNTLSQPGSKTTTHKASAASEGIIVKTDKSPGSLVVNKTAHRHKRHPYRHGNRHRQTVYEYWVVPQGRHLDREYSSDPDYTFTQAVPGTYTIYTYCKGSMSRTAAPSSPTR